MLVKLKRDEVEHIWAFSNVLMELDSSSQGITRKGRRRVFKAASAYSNSDEDYGYEISWL